MVTASELPININATALQMANLIFGPGTVVTGASYTGDKNSSGTWSNGDTVSGVPTPSNTGVILSTGKVQDFTNSSGQSNQSTSTSTNTSGPNNNAMFNAIAGTNTYDASWLDIDFIPTGGTMTLSFTFASEEYPEYASSIYNDIVGVWINGSFVNPEISAATSVTGVNHMNNQNLYISNTNDEYNTEMDGFTVTMSITFPVNVGVVNSIRIGIADVADSNYDSSLLIAADSAQTVVVAMTDDVTIGQNGTKTIDPLANDINQTPLGTLTITHINGQAVTAGQSVTLSTGQVVTLNADGTFTITTDADIETVNFTYQVKNILGISDVGYVTLHTVPCFVAGTLIDTPSGPCAVQNLRPGDPVMTLDDGPQPVRWIGRRLMRAAGAHAPVVIEPGTFGDHGRLSVSPLHRILIRDSLAELMFGEREVLVTARDLVNGGTVRQQVGGWVEYVHILFDRHQIVTSNGMTTESFLPGPQTSDSYSAEVLNEICAIFPEFDPDTGQGYSPAARRTLKAFEARLVAPRRAA
jgi:hypothetical protein